jgi:hypothetical protein
MKYQKILILAGIFLFAFSLRLPTINQIGRTWDEPEYVEQGYNLIELIRKRDFNNSYFYTTYDHPPLVKYLYGISAHFDVEKYATNKKPLFRYDYTYSRMFSALLFSLGVIFVVMIGWIIVSPTIGIFAGIILAMLPFSLGLSQLVTTESLKIFIYPLTVYSYILLVRKYSVKKLIFSGILTGIALQAKQSNIFIIPLLGFMYYFKYRQIKLKGKKKQKYIKKNLLSFFYIIAMSIIVFFLIWPQAPFHLREIYTMHNNLWGIRFSPNIWQVVITVPEVFMGRLMLTPIFYYPVYFFITIPVIILCLFFTGIYEIYTKKNYELYPLVIWFILPFLLSFYIWKQHGLRYVIEIYPAISLIAAIGFDGFLRRLHIKKHLKWLYFLPVIAYLFVQLLYVKPYYLDYFNELVGGVNNVYKYKWFQIGWWGQGEREAGIYIKNNAKKGSKIGLAISPDHVFPKFDGYKYSEWKSGMKYDYVIVNYYHIIRDKFNDEEIKKNYKLIYKIKADRAVLAFVYKRK